ncbi:hypothetical protein [Streptomyces tibetensis]|uniref:hypothetical protein n=1 Tax=Streptomyces tibetensis TaxID=2382123 RepID=UPI001108EE9C|nr:hypothetical protein [Streptomyces tibetensis]
MSASTAEASAARPEEIREFGRRLQLTRAGIWFAGNQGDPYAMILRATDDDSTPFEERIRAPRIRPPAATDPRGDLVRGQPG